MGRRSVPSSTCARPGTKDSGRRRGDGFWGCGEGVYIISWAIRRDQKAPEAPQMETTFAAKLGDGMRVIVMALRLLPPYPIGHLAPVRLSPPARGPHDSPERSAPPPLHPPASSRTRVFADPPPPLFFLAAHAESIKRLVPISAKWR